MLEWTGERYLPWTETDPIHYEHLHRYAFASQFVKDKRVIDLACGEGYGAAFLAKEAGDVLGIDIDKATIAHAVSRYKRDNLEFTIGSIIDIPVKGKGKFDVAVCFEAIEHITEHDKLLSEVLRVLSTDGLLVISTPNKLVYTDISNSNNPFHLKELYLDQFESLLNQYFKHVLVWGQRVYNGSDIWAIGPHKVGTFHEAVVQKADNELYFTDKASKEPVYFIALASNSALDNTHLCNYSRLTDLSDSIHSIFQTRIAGLNSAKQDGDTRITELSAAIQAKDARIEELDKALLARDAFIQEIMKGIIMRLMTKIKHLMDMILKPGTGIHHSYQLFLRNIHIIADEGLRSYWNKFK